MWNTLTILKFIENKFNQLLYQISIKVIDN